MSSDLTPDVLAFVDRFAEVMAEAGMPRMPARIFACLLASETGRMGAGELADALRISPAAVSGAVRYLGYTDLVARERPAGSRRDLFRVSDDTWYEAIAHRDQLMKRWVDTLNGGVEVLPEGSAARARLVESRDFLQFMADELPMMLERWRERRDAAD